MSLKRNILDLRRRKKEAQQGGGEAAIGKQVAIGQKNSPREDQSDPRRQFIS